MEILWQVFFKVSAYVNSPVFLRSFFGQPLLFDFTGNCADEI